MSLRDAVKSDIQDLLGNPLSKRNLTEKLKITRDGRRFPPSPKIKVYIRTKTCSYSRNFHVSLFDCMIFAPLVNTLQESEETILVAILPDFKT
jgi:hypothetical protein